MRKTVVLAIASFALLARLAPADDEKKPAAAPVDVPGFWTADELRRIDQGLEVLNVTRKDLGFQKRPIDDPFRLPVVDRILDDPLAIGAVAAEWDAVAREGDVDRLLVHAVEALAAPTPELGGGGTGPGLPHAPKVSAMLPDSCRAPLDTLLQTMQSAERDVLSPNSAQVGALVRKALLAQVEHPQHALDAPDLEDAAFLAALQRTDIARIRSQGWIVRHVAEFETALRAASPGTLATIRETTRETTAIGDVVLHGYGDDVHGSEDDNAILVIDLGGNDTYTRGASANLLEKRPVQVVIDLSGDDRYLGENDFSFGGALGGVAIQWDCAGNDTYIAGNCSCGAGILGVGVLVDEGGNDTYRVKDFGQGAGAFGIGLLLDKGGNDLYHADLYGQGFASTWGCGMLVEMSGNDVYDAGGAHLDTPLWRDRFTSLSQGFAIGNRPIASGGVGVLVDVSGNDHYSCDIYGQGCSYWYSLGLLIDDDGHDTYALGQYGQGAGIHLSCGMLLDRHGQDDYYDANGVGMGGAHDWSVGFLVDREGDDYYAGGGCAQGSGHTNSVGMLIDDAGDDGYSAVRGVTQGSASWTRGTGGIGLLLDGAGKDFYSEPTRNDAVNVQDTIGASLDEPTPPEKPSANAMAAAISQEDAAKKVEEGGKKDGAWDLDKLWAMVTAWEVGDNTVIMPIAREKFFALRRPALDRAFENLNAKDSLLTRAIELTLKEFAKTERDAVIARLVEKSKDADKIVRKNSVMMLSALEAKDALPRLVEMLTTDPDTTGTVLSALATMKTAPPAVASLLKAPKETVAVQAAVCLGAVGDAASIGALVGAMGEDHAFPVRLAAQERLAALGAAAVPALTSAAADPNGSRCRIRNALRALGQTKSAEAAPPLVAAFASKDPMQRLSAMLAADELSRALPVDTAKQLTEKLAAARASETDLLVRRLALPPSKR